MYFNYIVVSHVLHVSTDMLLMADFGLFEALNEVWCKFLLKELLSVSVSVWMTAKLHDLKINLPILLCAW